MFSTFYLFNLNEDLKTPYFGFFYCEKSRLVSITNDRQERKFKIHRSVENSKRGKSDPKKMHFLAKLLFLISLWTKSKVTKCREFERVFISEWSPLERRHKPMIALVPPRCREEIKTKFVRSKVRSNAKLIPHERNLGIWGRSQSWKNSILGELVLLAWIDKDDLVEMD